MDNMEQIKTGLSHECNEIVTKEKCASYIGSGLLDVYSTPSMIALMEKTSFLCINSNLTKDESSVGGALNIRHLRATAVGKSVFCRSTVSEVRGKKIVFEVEVFEGDNLIGKGSHVRFIIDKKAFMEML